MAREDRERKLATYMRTPTPEDIKRDLIREAMASHKLAVTINISESIFNDIHGDQNIHNRDDLSSNNSVRVDASTRLRLL